MHEFRRLSKSTASSKLLDALTEKEVEILRFVATGMSNKEIAQQLSYSEKTVKNYLSVIFQKLGIRGVPRPPFLPYARAFCPTKRYSVAEVSVSKPEISSAIYGLCGISSVIADPTQTMFSSSATDETPATLYE